MQHQSSISFKENVFCSSWIFHRIYCFMSLLTSKNYWVCLYRIHKEKKSMHKNVLYMCQFALWSKNHRKITLKYLLVNLQPCTKTVFSHPYARVEDVGGTHRTLHVAHSHPRENSEKLRDWVQKHSWNQFATQALTADWKLRGQLIIITVLERKPKDV